jgi:hypothetical protein
MSTKDDALTVFFARVERLKAMFGDYGQIAKARGIPAARVRDVNILRITTDGYGRMTPELDALAQRAFTHMKAEERAAGEAERDLLLAAYAAELESLRAILPSLAANASIELGVIARSLATQEQPQ